MLMTKGGRQKTQPFRGTSPLSSDPPPLLRPLINISLKLKAKHFDLRDFSLSFNLILILFDHFFWFQVSIIQTI